MQRTRATCCLVLVAVGQAVSAADPPRQTVTNSVGMELVPIPAGRFRMGDPFRKLSEEYCTVADVTITRPFLLGKTEVTQAQFKKVMGAEPWAGRSYTRIGDAYPAEWVTWREAEAFCTRLTESEHAAGTLPADQAYRLPTEAEWEYACRAGTQSLFPFGDDFPLLDEYCWTPENTVGAGQAYAHEVGTKKPNPWGLHDMLGNVSEWCLDFWDPTIDGGVDPTGHNQTGGAGRSVRGGSWDGRGGWAPGADRFLTHPGARSVRDAHQRSFGSGFRVARAAIDAPAGARAITRPQPTRAPRRPARGAQSLVYLGISTADSADGVVITAVDVDSPADVAGLSRDDVILTVQGRPITRASDFDAAYGHLLRPYERARFKVRRRGEKVVLSVVPSGHQRLALRPIDALIRFTVPGVPAKRPAAPANAVESLDAINVLTNVFIDRKTGAIEIVGHYDPRFPTGRIPYLDLLKTAIKHPSPSFSLEPDMAEMAWARRDLNSDTTPPVSLEETLAGRIYAVVMGHRDAELDRQRLLRAHAREYGISPEDFTALRNHLFLDADGGTVPPDIAAIQTAVLKNLGYEQAARAWAAIATSAADDAATDALRLLGKKPGDSPGSLRVQALMAILDDVRPRTAGRWGGLVRDVVEERMREEDLVVALQQALLPERDKSGTTNIYVDMFGTLNLSEATYGLMISNASRGVPVAVVPRDLDPTSQMHRILYEADYSLKSLDLLPELFSEDAHVPSLAGMHELGVVARLRQCWKPRTVVMTVSEDKAGISFGDVTMELECEITPADGVRATPPPEGGSAKRGVEDDVAKLKKAEDMVAGYRRHVEANYDAYAAALPSFHEVREAAKIVALARWINAEKIPVRLEGVAQERWTPPSAIFGLLKIAFTHTHVEGTDDIGTIYPAVTWSGGVSFADNAWVTYESSRAPEPTMPDALAASNQLGQQAAQAAVAGDLERASRFAELSAQAMTGALTRNDLAKVGVTLQRSTAMATTPAVVRLHKELSRKTYQQIETLRQDPTAARSTTDSLTAINGLYGQVRARPADATIYLDRAEAIRTAGAHEPPRAAKQSALAAVDSLAWIGFRGGRFGMGSPADELGRRESEDQAGVLFSRPFMISRTEITQRDYRTVTGQEPWKGQRLARVGDDFPATWVTWFDATDFCERLTDRGHERGWLPLNEVIRLPTEAEWEYACRSGEKAAYSFGSDGARLAEYAWFVANTSGKGEPFAHRVGTRKPNARGLHDMHGNVLEWCSDWYLPELLGGAHPRGPAEGDMRVARGGSWGSNPSDCRSAARFRVDPAERNEYLGFRVVRSYSDK